MSILNWLVKCLLVNKKKPSEFIRKETSFSSHLIIFWLDQRIHLDMEFIITEQVFHSQQKLISYFCTRI